MQIMQIFILTIKSFKATISFYYFTIGFIKNHKTENIIAEEAKQLCRHIINKSLAISYGHFS